MIGSMHLKTDSDIIEQIDSGKYDVIAHGCNCYNVMGAGVALLLNNYTEGLLHQVDQHTSTGDINKLGSFSSIVYNDMEFYNLYTQFTYGRDIHSVYVHWASVREALFGMVDDMKGKSVLIPLIGCGLANGKFSDLVYSVESVLKFYDIDVTLVTNLKRNQIK